VDAIVLPQLGAFGRLFHVRISTWLRDLCGMRDKRQRGRRPCETLFKQAGT